MDQLKPVIDAIKKYHFWMLMVIILVASIVFFSMSKSKLTQDIATQRNAIMASYSTVSSLSAKAQSHPNSFSQKVMDEIINVHKFDVQQAWALQYERQKQYLKWPMGVTSQEAIDKLDKMRPIETTVPNPMKETEDPISATYRAQYKDYISRVFPGIVGIIGANWEATEADARNVQNPNPLVKWAPESQVKMLRSIAPWSTRTPSTLEILYTQEDLWILGGLMNIIKSVNGDARENFQAPIKEIQWIRIGRSANGAAGVIEYIKPTAPNANTGFGGGAGYGQNDPYAAAAAAASSGAGAPYGGGSPYGGAAEGGVSGATAALAADPADLRYVDSNYKPVKSTDLISRMKSSDPKDAFFAVAKRVPIQLRVTMDQRRVSDLVAACGNNDLMVEVKQVRIGSEESAEAMNAIAAGTGAGGAGGYGSGYGASSSSMESASGGSPSSRYGGSEGYSGTSGYGSSSGYGSGGANSDVIWNEKGFELDVEIYGIILLFNPVDIDKLGIEKVQETTQLETAAVQPESTAPAPESPAPVEPSSTNDPSAEGLPPAVSPDAAPIPAPSDGTPVSPLEATPPENTLPSSTTQNNTSSSDQVTAATTRPPGSS